MANNVSAARVFTWDRDYDQDENDENGGDGDDADDDGDDDDDEEEVSLSLPGQPTKEPHKTSTGSVWLPCGFPIRTSLFSILGQAAKEPDRGSSGSVRLLCGSPNQEKSLFLIEPSHGHSIGTNTAQHRRQHQHARKTQHWL